MQPQKTIAVIGAGVQGRTFAIACAQAGYRVVLEDVMPSKLREVESSLPNDVRLEFASTVEDAVREADYAIDFVPDELESKLEMVCMIDRMAPPRTVLMINTTALDVNDLASCTYRAERCVGVSGGEVVVGSRTLPEVAADVNALFARLQASL
ncbi:MAG: NAD(P)-binding domain-containing protein [Acidobacteria bacterium]|nr:NAD(P)-binding domain-containing protein [Acidobacteriota bacterium]